ncbi:hypothetical protein [Spiroplasma endosymbiont of Nephrotoma flavescens]|uniref:hypothetical protein n=1 Tax=Spiroplasma endosymbiont of Nephrotoma flavescens TaxID=3066302 RepID=UPI00313CE48C
MHLTLQFGILFTSDDTKAIAVNKIQSNLQSKIHSQMTLKLTNAGEATTKLKAFANNDLEFSLNFGINKFIFKVTINKVNVGTNDIDEVEDFFNQEYDLDVSPTSNINDILAKINYQLEQKIANLKVININSDDGNRRFKYLRDELEVILVNNPTKIFKLRLKNIKYNIENERRLIDEYFEDNQIFFNLKNLDDLTEKINNDLKKIDSNIEVVVNFSNAAKIFHFVIYLQGTVLFYNIAC